jgi:hypothetical protein
VNPAGEERRPSIPARIGGILALLLFLGVLARILQEGLERPAMSYDMLDYMALALEWEEDDVVEVHRRTFTLAAAELPPEAYAALVGGTRFREAMRADPLKFDQNLAIHRGRILYSLAVYLLYKLGAPLSAATWYVSQFFFAASALFLLVWTRRHLALAPAALASLALVISPPLLALAPASMADSMTLFLILLAAYAWIELEAFRPAALVLTFAILVRPEVVLLIFASAAALWLFVERERRPSTRFLALWLAGSALLVAGLRRWTDDPGWWPVYLISFYGRADGRLEDLPGLDATLYWKKLAENAADLVYVGYLPVGPIVNGSTYTLAYAGFALVGLLLAARSAAARELQHHRALLVALLASCAARYFLFPYLWDRYYVHFLVLVPLLLLAMVSVALRRARPALALVA